MKLKKPQLTPRTISHIMRFNWAFKIDCMRSQHALNISHNPDRAAPVPVCPIWFVKRQRWVGWNNITYISDRQTLHCMTFFHGRPFSSSREFQTPSERRSDQGKGLHQTSVLMSSLSPLSKDAGSMWRILLSVFTQRLAYVASDLSVPRAEEVDHRPLCPLALLSQWGHGSIASSRAPTVWDLHPEATEMSQETLEGGWKDWQ